MRTIARVAANGRIKRNTRMEKIVELDKRYLGFSSAQWAKLLDCSESWIRKQSCWKEFRKKYHGPD